MKKLFFFSVFLACFSLQGQRLPGNSVHIGFRTSHGNDKSLAWQTGIGLEMDHQNNFREWFSLRIGLELNHFLPYTIVIPGNGNSSFPNVDLRRGTQVNHTSLNLDFTPLFYARDKYVRYFMGVGVGLGWLSRATQFGAGTPQARDKVVDGFITAAFSPVFGLDFPIGYGDAHEIEISFSYRIQSRITPPKPYDFQNLTLGVGYRYNLN